MALDLKEQLTQKLNERISANLKVLLKAEGLTYTAVIKKIEETDGCAISPSYLNKILNHPDQHSIPILFLLQCSEFFNITIDNLLSSNFDPYNKKTIQDSEINKFNSFLKQPERLPAPITSLENSIDTASPSVFIENPKHILFKSIIHQTYYCYFCPTVSKENKNSDAMICGTLKLEDNGDNCKTIFTVKTQKNNKNISKEYIGYSIISISVNCVYSILKCEEIGEYCFIIFRYFHLNYEHQDCLMAELLSTSSATKERYPTVLRMFLSKEEISPKHRHLISPHLWLNYSQIAISKEALFSLKQLSEDYDALIDKLSKDACSNNMYIFKEKKAVAIAENYLKTEEDIIKFITELRAKSYAFHYNKVSDTATNNIHKLLISLGYYQN